MRICSRVCLCARVLVAYVPVCVFAAMEMGVAIEFLQCGVRVFKLGGLFFPNLSPPYPPKAEQK